MVDFRSGQRVRIVPTIDNYPSQMAVLVEPYFADKTAWKVRFDRPIKRPHGPPFKDDESALYLKDMEAVNMTTFETSLCEYIHRELPK